MKKWNEDIFRKNDIRGIYKKDFDLSFVKTLAFSFVHLYPRSQKPVVALGHDSRLSSPEIVEQVAKSLKSAGAEVRFLGLVPSPVCFLASYFIKNINGSFMVTASHNPLNFNGFKMILNKKTLSGRKILKLKKIALTQPYHLLSSRPKGKIIPFDIESPYIAFHQKESSFSSFPKKNKPSFLKSIAIDCCNGASGPLTKKVFKTLNLPLKIHYLYTRPDGRFPHHPPDPSSEKNLKDLQKIIKEKKCDFGVAFDGDGDRLVIVGKSGKVLQGDELMSIFISDIFNRSIKPAKSKKPIIIGDVKCGDWFFNFLKKKNLKALMWKSGHSLIRQKTIKEKAIFGGELSGHFFFRDDFFPIDDGIYGLLRLINICLRAGKTPEELIVKKKWVETPEIRKPISDKTHLKRLKNLKNFYKDQKLAHLSLIDGVRVSFPGKAWGLARFSNTQKEWTFRFGGKKKSDKEKIQTDFFRLLNIK